MTMPWCHDGSGGGDTSATKREEEGWGGGPRWSASPVASEDRLPQAMALCDGAVRCLSTPTHLPISLPLCHLLPSFPAVWL